MGAVFEETLATFRGVHDRCLAGWDHACRTGETSEIAAYTALNFSGTSAYQGSDRAEAFERDEAVAGLGQLMQFVRGAVHRADNRLIRLRDETEAVVFYERVLERDEKVLMRFMVIQTWRLTGEGWRVVREAVEQLTA